VEELSTLGWPAMSAPELTELRHEFVDAMSRVASSVAIASTDGPAGRFALTVSAVTSVTADPPTLLVCINRKNPIEAALREHGLFLITMLRADQQQVAQVFAGRPERGEPYDFSAARWDASPNGMPLLSGAVAWFDCRLFATHWVGTHTIFIGRVEHAGSSPGMPLVYGRRSFAEMLQLPTADIGQFDLADPVWDEPVGEEWDE
jgi:flavin reductase (DIM6/NTAB) family NADH-FMN oxidoreductase RutF